MEKDLKYKTITIPEILITAKSTKVIWISISIIFVTLAILYALSKPALYKAQIIMFPPSATDIAKYQSAFTLINKTRTIKDNYTTVTADNIYDVFLKKITSETLQENFIEKHFTSEETSLESKKALFRTLIRIDKSLANNSIEISMKAKSPEEAKTWALEYVNSAIDNTKSELITDLESTITAEKKSIELEINSEKIAAEEEVKRQIARLEEALIIANRINLEYAPTSGNLITSYSGDSLYMKGSKTISVELDLLKNRKNNDPYIKNLNSLLTRLTILDGIKITNNDLEVVKLDYISNLNDKKTNPPLSLIAITALFISCIFNLLLIMILTMFRLSNKKIN